ncbi:hypothetical protein HZA33_02410, partial [Candidatus Pacearchaeota archaeon]|nr:hypothetical protein [Candidatus Pacearchaeota archaeon]
MSQSLIADKAWLDYQRVIINFLESIHLLKNGHSDAKPIFKSSIEILEKVKSPRYENMRWELKEIYGLCPDYERISQIAEQIEQGKLISSRRELERMLRETENY